MAEKKLNSLALAEAKAADIVKKANERRAALLGGASDAADQDLLGIKKKLQAEFDAQVYDTSEEEKRQNALTKKDIEEVYKHYEENSKACVELMLERIIKVDHKVFRNIKGDFAAA